MRLMKGKSRAFILYGQKAGVRCRVSPTCAKASAGKGVRCPMSDVRCRESGVQDRESMSILEFNHLAPPLMLRRCSVAEASYGARDTRTVNSQARL